MSTLSLVFDIAGVVFLGLAAFYKELPKINSESMGLFLISLGTFIVPLIHN